MDNYNLRKNGHFLRSLPLFEAKKVLEKLKKFDGSASAYLRSCKAQGRGFESREEGGFADADALCRICSETHVKCLPFENIDCLSGKLNLNQA